MLKALEIAYFNERAAVRKSSRIGNQQLHFPQTRRKTVALEKSHWDRCDKRVQGATRACVRQRPQRPVGTTGGDRAT